MRLHGGSLENLLLTTTGKGAEAPVATLAKLGSALTTVRWGNFDKHALVALDIFSITSLSLWSPDQAVVDLGPLHRLPDLQKLYLTSGSYTVDGLPKHLTSLDLRLCNLISAGSTQGKHLKKLSIVYSTFSGYKFDEDELLEELKISESCVKVDDAGDDDDFANANPNQGVNLTEHKLFCGADLSHLQKLRVLKLTVANRYTRYRGTSLMFDSLYFCYQLPLLEELRLESTSLHLIIGNELVTLRNLTSLTVSAARDGMAEGSLELRPEWSSMASLQHVHLCNALLCCGNEFLELLELKSLVSLTLTACTPADKHASQVIAAVLYGMGKHHPHVEVSVNDVCLADVIEQRLA